MPQWAQSSWRTVHNTLYSSTWNSAFITESRFWGQRAERWGNVQRRKTSRWRNGGSSQNNRLLGSTIHLQLLYLSPSAPYRGWAEKAGRRLNIGVILMLMNSVRWRSDVVSKWSVNVCHLAGVNLFLKEEIVNRQSSKRQLHILIRPQTGMISYFVYV